MHQEDLLDAVFYTGGIFNQQILPGVTGQAADGRNVAIAFVDFAKYAHFRLAVCQPAPHRVRRLPGDDADGVLRILDIVANVMDDTSRFRHTRSGDDDHRVGAFVQRLRLFHRADISQHLEIQRRMTRFRHELARFVIETFQMTLEDIGRIDCQRTIHIHGHARNAIFEHHLIQVIDQFLRASNSKGGHDHFSAAFYCLLHHIAEFDISQFGVVMRLIPVGAFHDHEIGFRREDRVAQQRKLIPADIARKPEADLSPLFLDLQ